MDGRNGSTGSLGRAMAIFSSRHSTISFHNFIAKNNFKSFLGQFPISVSDRIFTIIGPGPVPLTDFFTAPKVSNKNLGPRNIKLSQDLERSRWYGMRSYIFDRIHRMRIGTP